MQRVDAYPHSRGQGRRTAGGPREPHRQLQSDNPTGIDLAWDEITTLEEQGRSVPFPDSSLATTKYLFQYRKSQPTAGAAWDKPQAPAYSCGT